MAEHYLKRSVSAPRSLPARNAAKMYDADRYQVGPGRFCKGSHLVEVNAVGLVAAVSRPVGLEHDPVRILKSAATGRRTHCYSSLSWLALILLGPLTAKPGQRADHVTRSFRCGFQILQPETAGRKRLGLR